MRKAFNSTLLFCLFTLSVFARSSKKEVLSLSKGKYVETFDQDSIEQVGTVIYNVNSRQIVGLVVADDSEAAMALKPEVISRWLSVDPLAGKHPNISPYVFGTNNPILFKDDDGRDYVYFDNKGTEVNRFKSNEVFKTYVGSEDGGWKEAAMPKIIVTNAQGVATTAAYQNIDYQIAASTMIFNDAKNNGSLQLVTEGNAKIPTSADAKIPDLDPTLVKAITVQESQAGSTGITDVMQDNVKGDWSAMKASYGLQKGVTPDVKTSINAGIDILATKGFKGGITYDSKTGIQTYKFQGWDKATNNYNGGGVSNYGTSVKTMTDGAKTPTPADYSVH